jgi:hypothetical protein
MLTDKNILEKTCDFESCHHPFAQHSYNSAQRKVTKAKNQAETTSLFQPKTSKGGIFKSKQVMPRPQKLTVTFIT